MRSESKLNPILRRIEIHHILIRRKPIAIAVEMKTIRKNNFSIYGKSHPKSSLNLCLGQQSLVLSIPNSNLTPGNPI